MLPYLKGLKNPLCTFLGGEKEKMKNWIEKAMVISGTGILIFCFIIALSVLCGAYGEKEAIESLEILETYMWSIFYICSGTFIISTLLTLRLFLKDFAKT